MLLKQYHSMAMLFSTGVYLLHWCCMCVFAACMISCMGDLLYVCISYMMLYFLYDTTMLFNTCIYKYVGAMHYIAMMIVATTMLVHQCIYLNGV